MTIIEPKKISDQLLYCTIRLLIQKHNGDYSCGTGFLFSFDGKKETTYIITNKHVIDDCISGTFVLHEGHFVKNEIQPTGFSFKVQLEQLKKYCKYHPDPDVDLCAIPIKPIDKLFDNEGKHFFSRHLNPEMIMSDENLKSLGAVEDVLMTGYPLGLWDESNNFPLIRKGITSSHPATDFLGKSLTVIDIATFPGSSGSPVLVINDRAYVSSSGIPVENRAILLGVLSERAIYTLEGEVIMQKIPTVKKQISQKDIPTHLGYIIKAKEILKMGLC